ncbi:MAG: methyltransferase domain-containing protein [Candidatus Omnitrophota bacterium]
MKSVSGLARDIYKNEGYKVRVHVFLRAKTCPFEKIAEHIPDSIRILDLGCGNGMFVNYLSICRSSIEAVGVDISESNIAIARRTIGERRDIQFVTGDISELGGVPIGANRFDYISMIDSLYFLPFARQCDAIRYTYALLRENGILLIKTISREALLKYWFCKIQDRIAMKLLRLYADTKTHVLSSEEMKDMLDSAGFGLINRIELGRGSLYPHILYICKK